MPAEDPPRQRAGSSPRHRGETTEPSEPSSQAPSRIDREQRWTAEKAGHWHNAGYSSETQARSDAESHT